VCTPTALDSGARLLASLGAIMVSLVALGKPAGPDSTRKKVAKCTKFLPAPRTGHCSRVGCSQREQGCIPQDLAAVLWVPWHLAPSLAVMSPQEGLLFATRRTTPTFSAPSVRSALVFIFFVRVRIEPRWRAKTSATTWQRVRSAQPRESATSRSKDTRTRH
jgi:hypothetical protein